MNSVQNIIQALTPVFAAGFAVQQLLEILTSFFDLDSNQLFQKFKKPILGAVAFGFGCVLASQLDLGVLEILNRSPLPPGAPPTPTPEIGWVDFFATALIISAGTEGVNSILKFLKYSKEDKKREAAGQDPQSAPALPAAPAGLAPAGVAPLAVAAPAPTEVALLRINRQ
jgi:hypothetical protein